MRRPTGSNRVKQKAETQSVILESAKSLFEKTGFEKTTIRQIAMEADVGLGTIFNYFPNKSALLVAALLDDLVKIEAAVFGSLPADAPIIDKCILITEAYYCYYAKRPALSRTLIKESNFIQGEFGDLLSAKTENFIGMVAQLMIDAREKGELRKDADCQLAGIAYFSFFLRYLFAGLNSSRFDVKKSVDTIRRLLEQLMAGIRDTAEKSATQE